MATRNHTLNIGDIEVTTYDDGHFVLPAEYFTNVPNTRQLDDQIKIHANLWTVRSGDQFILVDTGSADVLKERFPKTGQAWSDLRSVTPTDVVLTHMHADHLGGFVDGTEFPDARIHVSQAEWSFWTNPDLPTTVPADLKPMVMKIQSIAESIAERVVLHDSESQLAPGIHLTPLPGHTPGHSGLRIHSGGDELLIIGDAIISEELQFTHPDISYALDSDAEQAAATRRSLLSDAADRGTIVAATHFAFPGMGRAEPDQETYRFRAL